MDDPFGAYRRYLAFGISRLEASHEQQLHFNREGWVKIKGFLKPAEVDSLNKVLSMQS